MSETDPDFLFDPQDASKAKNFVLMDQIRARCPVCRPAPGLVLTTRYDDTRAAFKDTERFSSVGDMRAPGVVVPIEESFLGEIDAPLHPKIRLILMRGFTPKAALAAENWTRRNVRERLSALASSGGGDFMKRVAIPLPGSVSAHVLGIPDQLHETVMDWCDQLLHSTWPSHGRTERGVGIAGAFPELAAILDALIAQRKEDPEERAGDLIGVMARTRGDDGWQIGDQHIRTLMVNILAGSLSASYMLGNLAYRFLSDQEFQTALRAQSDLIPAAVEESLRFEPPVSFLFRTARADTKIGGETINAGEHIMLGIAAANRDPAAYPNADQFLLTRKSPADHVAFGYGPHVCLGNHLTRMIGRVVLEELITIRPQGGMSLAPDFEWTCVKHHLEYGPETLVVQF